MSRQKYKKYSMEELYEVYVNQYAKSEGVQNRYGMEARHSMASFNDFVAEFEGQKKNYKELGKNFSVKQVAQMMAKDDVSHVTIAESEAQGFAISLQMYRKDKITGHEIHPTAKKIARELRIGKRTSASDEFWNAVSLRYKELKEKGNTGKDAKKIISQEFFGSP